MDEFKKYLVADIEEHKKAATELQQQIACTANAGLIPDTQTVLKLQEENQRAITMEQVLREYERIQGLVTFQPGDVVRITADESLRFNQTGTITRVEKDYAMVRFDGETEIFLFGELEKV